MCGFSWTSSSGERHECSSEHKRGTVNPMHRCACGATKTVDRVYPEDHLRKVREAQRAKTRLSRDTATVRGKPWSEEDVEALVAASVLGLSGMEVARGLGRTYYAVVGKAHALGVPLGSRHNVRRHGVASDPEDV